MIAYIGFYMLANLQVDSSVPQWVRLVHISSGNKTQSSSAGKKIVTSTLDKADTRYEHPVPSTRFREGLAEANAVNKKIGGLITKGQFEDAYSDCMAFYLQNPDLEDSISESLAKSMLFSHHFTEASAYLMKRITSGRNASNMVLMLSASEGCLGHLYTGQAKYAKDQLLAALQTRFQGVKQPLSPETAINAKEVAIQSCLSGGFSSGRSGAKGFFALAHWLDNSNKTANDQLDFLSKIQNHAPSGISTGP